MHPVALSSRARLTIAQTAAFLILLTGTAWPLDGPQARATLKGISAIAVQVAALNPAAERAGLTREQLRTDVELRLRSAGVTVAASPSAETRSSYLSLLVATVTIGTPEVYSFAIQLELFQPVACCTPLIYAQAITWSDGGLGYSSAQDFHQSLLKAVGDTVDRFISAYREQNPKQ